KRKRLINQIKDNNKTLILCKQNSYIFLLTGITFIMNATSNINSIVHGKNMDMFLNEGIELNGFIDFINRSSINEKVDIFIYGMLIILGIVFILEWLSSFAIISDDKIVFNNGNVFNFSEITDIKYREALFSKRKIIKLIKNGYEEEIIIKVEDFEKVSEYLETHISM
ncbi:MAG: hypothetical protein ACRCXT_07390, partial [Paraclostridium sp.]